MISAADFQDVFAPREAGSPPPAQPIRPGKVQQPFNPPPAREMEPADA